MVKRYDLEHIAKRNCASCTTTITTTEREFYVLATDYASLLAVLRQCVYVMEIGGEWNTPILWAKALAAAREKLEGREAVSTDLLARLEALAKKWDQHDATYNKG
jgi:hypothetical protein